MASNVPCTIDEVIGGTPPPPDHELPPERLSDDVRSSDDEDNTGNDDDDINRAVDQFSDSLVSVEEKRGFKKWLRKAKKRPIGIFVTGRTGSGKSALLNTIIGEKTLPEGGGTERCTTRVEEVTVDKKETKIKIWDCPGLQDGTRNEAEYLESLRTTCNKQADLMLYCIDLRQCRSTDEFELKHTSAAVQKITEHFGVHIWKRAIVVLTFANIVADRLESDSDSESEANDDGISIEEKFNKIIIAWAKKFQTTLQTKAGVKKEVANQVAVVPAGYRSHPSLPGREHWFSEFWMVLMLQASGRSRANFFLLAQDRFINPNDIDAHNYSRRNFDTPIVLTEKVKMLLIASTLGATGATIGAGIGSAIGAVTGVVSFGPLAGIGLGVGGVIGAGVGFGVGCLIGIFRYYRKKKQVDRELQFADSPP